MTRNWRASSANQPAAASSRGSDSTACSANSGRAPDEGDLPLSLRRRRPETFGAPDACPRGAADAYGSINWKGAITARLYRAGETIHFREGSAAAPGEIIGVLEGIGAGGELLVRENATGRLRSCFSGEIAPGM
jgi:hypothetical protein